MNSLQAAYLANILVLLPVAVPTLLRLFPTEEGRFVESAGWRILVGSLWTGILLLSFLGLREPLRFSPVLFLQVIYKSLWLLTYVLPRMLRREWKRIPIGMTISFLIIVVIWPWLIPWSYLLGRE